MSLKAARQIRQLLEGGRARPRRHRTESQRHCPAATADPRPRAGCPHVSPAHSENINFFGGGEVDIDAELAQLGPTGYRLLRVRDTLF